MERASTVMTLSDKSANPSIRHKSIGGFQTQSPQSPMLLARISEKKAELENLKQLKDLSADLASRMSVLEEKLSNLSNGTEGLFDISAKMACIY